MLCGRDATASFVYTDPFPNRSAIFKPYQTTLSVSFGSSLTWPDPGPVDGPYGFANHR